MDLGSIKYLAEAGIESITYYETTGSSGLFMDESKRDYSHLFPAGKGEIFPEYGLLKNILEYSGAEVLDSHSSFPLQFDGLVLKRKGYLRILLASYSNKEMKIKIPSVEGIVSIRQVDAEALKNKIGGPKITHFHYLTGKDL